MMTHGVKGTPPRGSQGVNEMPNIEETAARAADTATGAAAEAAEAVTDPAKQARRFERRGAPINRRLVHQAEDWARETARTARETR